MVRRYFTQLSTATKAYYEVDTPITLTGDFEIDISFSTSEISTRLFFGGGVSPQRFYVGLEGGKLLVGNGVNRVVDTLVVADGKLRNVKIKLVGNDYSVLIDGDVRYSGDVSFTLPKTIYAVGIDEDKSAFPFGGILSDLKVIDRSGSEAVTTTQALDGGKGVITESSLEGNNSVTRFNVVDEDTELFEKTSAGWSNISPLPQLLPATLEVV